jgi:hypothetical protein
MMFSPRERTERGSKNHGETDWQYLDRSGRPAAQKVRDLLTSWLASYPEVHRGDLVSRMRGGDDTEFQAATFELLLYSALSRLGCTIEVHPTLPTSTRHPDFLATSPSGDRVYVEAVLASEFSQDAKAAQRRTKVVLDAIERVDSPDFFIAVDAEGYPETPPSGRRLRAALQRWISGLSYDAVAADLHARGNDALPTFSWSHEGWEISFDAIPKKPDRRGQGQRTIGAIFGEARRGTSNEVIKEAVKFKGGRYGDLPHPLLVAINVDSISVDKDDEVGAHGDRFLGLSEDPSHEGVGKECADFVLNRSHTVRPVGKRVAFEFLIPKEPHRLVAKRRGNPSASLPRSGRKPSMARTRRILDSASLSRCIDR